MLFIYKMLVSPWFEDTAASAIIIILLLKPDNFKICCKNKKKTTSANKYELNIVIFNSCVDVIVMYLFSKWMFLSKTN